MINDECDNRKWTERSSAPESAIMETETMLRLLFERSADAITLSDPSTGAFLDVNDASVRITGAPDKASLLRGGPEMISPKFQPDGKLSVDKVKEVIGLAMEKGSHRFEWVLTRFDGTELPVDVVLTPIRTGERALVLSVARDISERKRTEAENFQLRATLEQRIAERTAELAASEARMRTLVEHAPEAIVVFDGVTGRFLSGNANACQIYGCSLDELTKLTPIEVSPEFQADGRRTEEVAREKIAEALAGGTPVFEWIHRHKNGQLIPTEVRLVRLPAEGKNLLRASIIDNTERKRLEGELRRRSERVKKHRDVLLKLARADKSDFDKAVRTITTLAASTLEVARVSYWSLQDNDSALVCEILHVNWSNSFDEKFKGTRLSAKDAPAYFSALEAKRPIVASNVLTHPATSGLIESYLKPLGISSMLDVPVWVSGEVVGVICHEHIGPAREWSAEEIDFASSLAAMTSLAIEESNRARSERLLRESEEKFRALFESSSQGVMLHDEKQFLEVNPAAVRMLGYERQEELIGKHPVDTSPAFQPNGEPSPVAAQRHIQECLTKGSARFEWMIRHCTGRDLPAEVVLTRVEWSGRQLIQAFVTDISERKAAEEALRKSEEKFKQLFELSPLGMAQVNWDGSFVQVNTAFANIIGFSRDEVIKLTYWDVTPREYEQAELAVLEQLKQTGRFGPHEKEYFHKNGHRVPVVLNGMMVTAPDGTKQLWGIVENITERKRAEAELHKALAREKEITQIKSSFVSMVSHEFRTPLGIIQSSAEILRDYFEQLDSGERGEQLRSIVKNTRRMAEMMEEILALSRLDAGKIIFKPQPINLASFCRRVVDEVLSSTNRKCGIELSLAPIPNEANADDGLLGHIFTNLLTNAVKYSEPGGTVRFDIEHDGTNAVCMVRDQGIGISAEDQQKLFTAFQRGDNVGDRPGTGLGLVLVKRCVELHGGEVTIQSEVGKGTAVTVRLPVFEAQS
jgi:PAS domain S-box-containing protein